MIPHEQNPANNYEEQAAVADFGDTLAEIRASSLLSVCLGCGTTTSAPMESPTEDERRFYVDLIDWDAIDCCPGADRITYR